MTRRDALIDALSSLGTLGDGIVGGDGAIYLFGKLPQGTSPCFASAQALQVELSSRHSQHCSARLIASRTSPCFLLAGIPAAPQLAVS